jgi:hypothetical protein
MASPDLIAAALLARCATLAVGSPALPVAYPEITFDPPTDGKYLEASLFFNRPAWEAVDSGKQDQGLLQVTVVWPRGAGVIAPMEAAAEVLDHFPKALSLSDGVRISAQPWAASPIIEGSETRIPVTIPWTA